LVASHSNARALCDVPRNLDDSQIRAIAQSNGLIGVCLHQPLLVEGENRATMADVVKHIDHIRKVAGATHVALGTDFEGRITNPQGLGRIEDLATIREELQKRRYSESDLDAILWQNVLRLVPD
jgi:membrane dipeptidase